MVSEIKAVDASFVQLYKSTIDGNDKKITFVKYTKMIRDILKGMPIKEAVNDAIEEEEFNCPNCNGIMRRYYHFDILCCDSCDFLYQLCVQRISRSNLRRNGKGHIQDIDKIRGDVNVE